jgi:hypothetical protein
MTTHDDLSDRIERIERLLASGAKAVEVDGTKTQVDIGSLRAELRKLRDEYDKEWLRQASRRPAISSISLRSI